VLDKKKNQAAEVLFLKNLTVELPSYLANDMLSPLGSLTFFKKPTHNAANNFLQGAQRVLFKKPPSKTLCFVFCPVVIEGVLSIKRFPPSTTGKMKKNTQIRGASLGNSKIQKTAKIGFLTPFLLS